VPNTAQVHTISIPAALSRAIFADEPITVVSNCLAELFDMPAYSSPVADAMNAIKIEDKPLRYLVDQANSVHNKLSTCSSTLLLCPLHSNSKGSNLLPLDLEPCNQSFLGVLLGVQKKIESTIPHVNQSIALSIHSLPGAPITLPATSKAVQKLNKCMK
jgi:hypothetical protein